MRLIARIGSLIESYNIIISVVFTLCQEAFSTFSHQWGASRLKVTFNIIIIIYMCEYGHIYGFFPPNI